MNHNEAQYIGLTLSDTKRQLCCSECNLLLHQDSNIKEGHSNIAEWRGRWATLSQMIRTAKCLPCTICMALNWRPYYLIARSWIRALWRVNTQCIKTRSWNTHLVTVNWFSDEFLYPDSNFRPGTHECQVDTWNSLIRKHTDMINEKITLNMSEKFWIYFLHKEDCTGKALIMR